MYLVIDETGDSTHCQELDDPVMDAWADGLCSIFRYENGQFEFYSAEEVWLPVEQNDWPSGRSSK